MPSPTDRGYVVISSQPDGTATVEVSTRPQGRGSKAVYATHYGITLLDVSPAVALVDAGGGRRFTQEVVQVFADDAGRVHLAAP